MQMRPRVLASAILSLLLVAVGLPAHADVSWSVAVSDDGSGRANYAYEEQPGSSVEDTWVLTNSGSEQITLRVFGTDAVTTSSGQLDLIPSDQEPTGLGSWVTTSADEVTLEPGEKQEIDVTISVPDDATPGDYAGGLVSVLAADGGGTVAVERRLGTRIHLRVPGDVTTSLAVSDLTVDAPPAWNPFAAVDLAVSYRVTNDGTGRALAPEVFTASGPGGLGSGRTTGEVPETLPSSTVDRATTVAGVWALGPTTVSVTVQPTGIDGTSAEPVMMETTVWVVPWGWIAIVAVVAVAGIVVAIVSARSRYEWVDAEEAGSEESAR